MAWGLIIAYFSIFLWRPLGIVMIFWSLLNALGALYTLQHYAVDLILGAFIGMFAIITADLLMKFEKKYLNADSELFSFIDMAQKDIRLAKEYLFSTFSFWREKFDEFRGAPY
ncbi:MAG: hypothetical protein HYW34_01010 [Candidatus Brennerbacteria bacterium]|nr:hypothetical protein [Candidatus Brennerbacteria bacterium]